MDDLFIAAEALSEVHSFSDLIDWYLWIPLLMQIIVAAGSIGLIALIWVFIGGILMDNHQ